MQVRGVHRILGTDNVGSERLGPNLLNWITGIMVKKITFIF